MAALLFNPARTMFQVPTALKPAMLVPDSDLEAPLQTAPESQPRHPALSQKDTWLPDAEETWFKDKSNFVQSRLRYERAAVTTMDEPLPAGTSAQRPELTALTKALKLGYEIKLTIIQTAATPLQQPTYMRLYIKKEASRVQKERLLKIRLRSWTF